MLDTNIWLEVLLEQEKENQVHKFLSQTDSSYLNITDFTIFSIGIILSKLEEFEILDKFYRDVVYHSGVNIIRLTPPEVLKIIEIQEKYGLDFDDSYQYVSAKENNLQFVSFDGDFDDTNLKRLIPNDIIED